MTQHVTGDDVSTAIASQHARIATLFEHLDNCPVEGQPAALHALTAFLAGHEAVEEELVHPLIPRVGDHDQGLERAREEAGMGEQILRLEQLDKGSTSFNVQLSLLEDTVKNHSRREEVDELPRLARSLTPDQAALIVEALHAHESSTSRRTGGFAEMLEAARAEVRDLVAAREAARH
jgi:hypothetical protein